MDANDVNAANAVVALDFISTFAFAWVGARVAATKNMDYGGILFVAAVSALSDRKSTRLNSSQSSVSRMPSSA